MDNQRNIFSFILENQKWKISGLETGAAYARPIGRFIARGVKMSDSELLEMAYTIMERIKLQRGINLDSYTGARLHEWLRRYKNRPTMRAVDCALCHCPTIIIRDGIHCVNCGRVYQSHSH